MNEQMESINQTNENVSIEEKVNIRSTDNTLMSAFDVDNGTASSQENGASTTNDNPSGNPTVEDNLGDGHPSARGQLSEQELRYRKLQSQYDKLFHQNEEVVRNYEEALKAKEFVNELLEDDQTFEAFVYERKPDLLEKNKSSIVENLEERLEAKFGDYKPDSRDDTSAKAYLYFKELDALYDEVSSKGNPKKLSELKEARKIEAEKEKQRVNTEIQKAKELMKWNDEQVGHFQSWANKLGVVDLMKMYNFALKTNRVSPSSSIASARGHGFMGETARESFLNSLK
jgi:hypothetical protein